MLKKSGELEVEMVKAYYHQLLSMSGKKIKMSKERGDMANYILNKVKYCKNQEEIHIFLHDNTINNNEELKHNVLRIFESSPESLQYKQAVDSLFIEMGMRGVDHDILSEQIKAYREYRDKKKDLDRKRNRIKKNLGNILDKVLKTSGDYFGE